MKALGFEASNEAVEKMIKEVDVDNSGTIDFDEFQILMKDMLVICSTSH